MKEDNFAFNHHPAQVGEWFIYNGFRYKFLYDIETYSGEIYENAYPNSTAWLHPKGRVTDQEVHRLRITANLGHPASLGMSLSELVEWTLESYSENLIPEVRVAIDGTLSYHPKLIPVEDKE